MGSGVCSPRHAGDLHGAAKPQLPWPAAPWGWGRPLCTGAGGSRAAGPGDVIHILRKGPHPPGAGRELLGEGGAGSSPRAGAGKCGRGEPGVSLQDRGSELGNGSPSQQNPPPQTGATGRVLRCAGQLQLHPTPQPKRHDPQSQAEFSPFSRKALPAHVPEPLGVWEHPASAAASAPR